MADVNRSVDLSKVVDRLATQLAESSKRIALLEVAFEDTIEQATALHAESLDLKQKLAISEAKLEETPKAVSAETKRPGK